MTTPNNDLRSLIDAEIATRSGAREHPQGDRPRRRELLTAELSHAVEQARTEPVEPTGQPAQVSASRSLRVLAIAGALAVLAAAWVWHGKQPSLTGHPATLHDLAQGVEHYRSEHSGSLPGELSNLAQFPKNAVEWQLRHWKARDAAGRTEILWAPNGSKHYRIVLRHGSEVWVYNDIDGQSKQTNQ